MFLELHLVALVDDDNESSSEVVDEHDESVNLICDRSITQLGAGLQC